MKSIQDIIVRPIISEKSMAMSTDVQSECCKRQHHQHEEKAEESRVSPGIHQGMEESDRYADRRFQDH